MLNSKSLKTISFTARKDEYASSEDIYSIRRWRDGSNLHKPLRHRAIFRISFEDGTLIEEEDFIYQYPTIPKNSVPIVGNINLTTGYEFLEYSQSNIGRQENLLGRTNNTTIKGTFIEEFMSIIPFNPILTSGKKIDLEIYSITKSGENNKLSKSFSGSYIIEECEHVWDGVGKSGYTRLLLGRKFINLPSTYQIRSKFIS